MQRLSQAVDWIGAVLQGRDQAVTGACIDTRVLQPGQLFIALPGSRVDGHEFVRKAAALGASGALVSRPLDIDFPQLVVPDVLVALQTLAVAWRQEWARMGAGQLVGVTGSNGKTSVKTMLATVLGGCAKTFATPGNLNNHIGVPLCLLNVRPEHRYAVIEMGANHAGEIATLAGWAEPDVGLVNNAGDAHLEGFGSRDGVAAAKGEMFTALGAEGVAVINADDPYNPLWRELAGQRKAVTFGRAEGADVRAANEHNALAEQRFTLTVGGQGADVRLPLPGRHSVMNALAAAAVAHALGLDVATIAAGLARVSPVSGRLQAHTLPGGVSLINDAYNANPASLLAAIDVLAASAPPRHLVLGDMAEIGAGAARAHSDAGDAARARGIERLWGCGPLSRHAVEAFGDGARHFDEPLALAGELASVLGDHGTVLVKGSRSAGMERVVHQLKGEA
ncbi:MAG: UDP-N-acetylmuramoyl-tripeptide--D-alanyl-D-alanine ligase [Oceanococcus sp.]|nr:MAG: UDP-N-acetylmuramoyl-tripeptide--D-alanyl-D-alanine ligase [Oceanococcus sp.]